MFIRHELVERNGRLEVILYMEPLTMEFAAELGSSGGSRSIREAALQYVREKLPHIKVAAVAVMSGSFLLGAFPVQKASAHEADFNMSYVFFGGTDTYIQQVDRTQGNLNVVSPSYFNLAGDGSLQITGQWDSRFVTEMHQRGIRVVPFLSNHWDRALGRAALANREQLSQQIADFILRNNLDGVNVDIENVTELDRAAYTDLVRLLREKLPPEKEVSVAVAANPYGWSTGWHGSYDYAALAQYADYLMMMAYDESYQGGPAGPVASYPWVEKSVKAALDKGVPAEKLVLGVPFFGRYWKQGEANGGYGIPAAQVEALVKQFNGTVIYDTVTKSPKAIITIPEGSSVKVYGRSLTPGVYHMYYENAASIQEKTRLVHQYNLKGTGSWSLGGEDASVWSSYKLWMTSHDAPAVPAAAPAPPLAPVVKAPSVPAKPAAVYPLLKPGMKGTAVTRLQTALQKHGLYLGKASGIYDGKTREAVMKFQKKHRLAADGIAGTATQTKLYSTPAPAAAKAAVPAYKLLKQGAKGGEVKTLQQALYKLGYLRTAPTGLYDAKTKAAVIAFQKKYKLAADGIAGIQTQTKLFSLVK